MFFSEVIDAANNLVWSVALVGLLLLAGLYFTVRTVFLQVRCIPDMLSQLKKGESSPDGTSSFQSLMMSLAGRVGMGNIGGVATAIALGGPGAVFWMWLIAFLGAATSFIECTLGQIYKERDKDTGEYRGGPAFYIEKAFAHTPAAGAFKIYALVFAVATVLAMSFFLPGVQGNGVSSAAFEAWGIAHWQTAVVMIILLAFIIIGGVKRIAVFAAIVVPVMAVLYIVAAMSVFFINFDQIGEVFGTIFSSAFGAHAVFGAIVGQAIMLGVKRGLYSNEAGQGTGPHAAAAAEVSHPAKQGFAQSFAVYIDTLFVCSATAFLIISTDMYKVFDTSSGDEVEIYSGSIPEGTDYGPEFAQNGFETVFAGLGPTFVAIALFFFAFTTIVAYYYMAEVNLYYLLRFVPNPILRRALLRALQALLLAAVVYGSVTTTGQAWLLGDIGVGSMAWLNVIAILILQGPALKALHDYQRQKKQGLDPQFDPRELGIKNAPFWEERADKRAKAKSAGVSS